MTLGITTFILMTFSITIKNAKLTMIALDTLIFSVVMLSVTNKPIMLSVVAPFGSRNINSLV
jgi:hypothetical protein